MWEIYWIKSEQSFHKRTNSFFLYHGLTKYKNYEFLDKYWFSFFYKINKRSYYLVFMWTEGKTTCCLVDKTWLFHRFSLSLPLLIIKEKHGKSIYEYALHSMYIIDIKYTLMCISNGVIIHQNVIFYNGCKKTKK
jgi:hypothetical protein